VVASTLNGKFTRFALAGYRSGAFSIAFARVFLGFTVGASTDIYFTLCGAAVALLGVWLFYVAFVRDRSRGRRRCPRCWYDLSGRPQSMTCSECGHTARSERRLHRTRRRWGPAMISLFIMPGGYVLMRVPEINRGGWLNAIPTTALILIHPYYDIVISQPLSVSYGSPSMPAITMTQDIASTLSGRMQSGASGDPKWCGLYRWQWWLLLRNARALERANASNQDFQYRTSTFYDVVQSHAEFWSLKQPAWPFNEICRTPPTIALTGGRFVRNGTRVTAWELRVDSEPYPHLLIKVTAKPLAPPEGSLGVWVPRELSIGGRRWHQVLISEWAVQQPAPDDPQVMRFRVTCSITRPYSFASNLPSIDSVNDVQVTFQP
jgi:hypothetical protein